jgi:hypothetical protein
MMSSILQPTRDDRASQIIIVGLVLGTIVGFLVRPSIPLLGQLPFITMLELVVTGGDGLEGLFVPLAQRSFMYMMVGGIVGGFLGWLAVQVAGAPLARTAAHSDNLRACPFCAEMIQAQARICRYCNRSIEAAVQ